MPSPKRWFPFSRDINDDPESWELTEEFGDRALRIHVEVLAIIDKTENEWRLTGHWLTGLSRKVRQQPATVQRVVDWMLAKGWLVAEEPTGNGSPMILRARNYWKYHRRRETNGSQEETIAAPSLPILPLTNLPVPNLEKKEIKKLRGEGTLVHTSNGRSSETGMTRIDALLEKFPHLRETS